MLCSCTRIAAVGVKVITVLGCGGWLCCRFYIPVSICERLWWFMYTTDYESNLLFWVDTKQHVVVSCDLNGRKRSILLTSTHTLHHAIAITVFEVMTAAHSKLQGVPRRQPHRRSGLATLPSVGAIP